MTISQRDVRKMEADREELAERIARVLPRNGVSEPQPGVHLSRFAHTNDPTHTVLEPCFCVIAQGVKTLTLAGDVYRYDPSHYADATVRLMRLVERPDDEFRAVSPLVVREIVYRLLAGAQGSRMRQLASAGGQAHRMVTAIEKLRTNYDKPLRIEALAKQLGMSLSRFHAHFKTVTAMSPLQYQKHIRLQEARRLMVSEDYDAAEA